MIAYACPYCAGRFGVKDDFAGGRVGCPTCKRPLMLPAPVKAQVATPQGQIEGVRSSLSEAGVDGGVTLGDDAGVVQKGASSNEKERYVLGAEIARGGMGAVLKAVDCDIRREVAVKFLLDQGDEAKKIRFVEEAQITGQLEHPNIVPVHEVGLDARGRLFFSMKIVRGRSLAQILAELSKTPRAERDFPLSRLLTILVNVCNGLAYAHSRGVIHRDLKPANIMIGDFGEVYVMDWGLAKVLRHGEGSGTLPFGQTSNAPSTAVVTNRATDSDQTQDGAILGTPVYMPPEQAKGQVQAIDQRSDVYSLGAILYQMLTLLPPVDPGGGSLAVLMRVASGEITPPEKRVPEKASKIPVELSAVAMKALALDPARRYASVEDMRRDIERYQQGRSVSARQDSYRELAWKLARRNRGATMAAASIAAVLLLTMILVSRSWWQTGRANQEKAAAYDALRMEQRAKEERTRKAVPAFVQAARQAANYGLLKEAIEQVNLALAYAPDNARAHCLKGEILIAQKDLSGARKEFLAYLSHSPDDPDARWLLAQCTEGKLDDPWFKVNVADVLQRRKMHGLAAPLIREAQELIRERQSLLTRYQKHVEGVWPGRGSQLSLNRAGEFALNLYRSPEVSSLAPIDWMPISDLNISHCPISDLSPLRKMRSLTRLNVGGCPVQDLDALRGLQLAVLAISGTRVDDLSPLEGMPLVELWCHNCTLLRSLEPLRKTKTLTTLDLSGHTKVVDLGPLKGAPMRWLNVNQTRITDLKPLQGKQLEYLSMGDSASGDLSLLKGMPLVELHLGSKVTDVSPLKDMKTLRVIGFSHLRKYRGIEVIREMKNLTKIGCHEFGFFPPAKFWERYDKLK